MPHLPDGILLIDKAVGRTSQGVVGAIRKRVGRQKVGHAGTLDPFATGLLVMLLGSGTKLSPYVMAASKVYRATLRLGISTDTLDCTGRETARQEVPPLDREAIQTAAARFEGVIWQTPPAYSAVKIRGVEAYKRARRGEEVAPAPRRVEIYRLVVTEVALPDITLEVHCGSGTYIRALGADLGAMLGTGGHLTHLRRLACGRFGVEQALPEAALAEDDFWERAARAVIGLKDALPEMPAIALTSDLASQVRNGCQVQWRDLGVAPVAAADGPGHIKLTCGNELVAVARTVRSTDAAEEGIRLERVFGVQTH